MKKFAFVLLVLVLCLGLAPVTALAADVPYPVTGGNIYFDANTGTITGCDKSVTEANIPEMIYDVPVVAIGRSAFDGTGQLHQITLPDTVQSIGAWAFPGSGIESIVIPDGVTVIGENTFGGCRSLKQVSIPDSVTSIENFAFKSCLSLTEITIPDSVTVIGENAFDSCNALTVLSLGSGLTTIKNAAFMDCTSLTELTIPASVTHIGTSAFAHTGMTSLRISGNVNIKSSAFNDCDNLTNLVIEAEPVLGDHVFTSCSNLKTVTVLSGRTFLPEGTFGGCRMLSAVTLPKTLQVIGSYAFDDCFGLTDVYYEGDVTDWSSVNITDNKRINSATIHFNSTGPNAVGPSSDWAKPEMEKAEEMDLIPEVLKNQDLTKPITRAEFAAVSVKVFENLSGGKAVPIVNNPFTDTKDVEVLKAYGIGAVNGTSAATFTPDALLNREQCATMLTRVFKRITLAGWTLDTDSRFKLDYVMPARFADDAEISDYARDSVYFMAANGIINGVGSNRFAPKNTTTAQEAQGYANATREQALAIAVRMVENLG